MSNFSDPVAALAFPCAKLYNLIVNFLTPNFVYSERRHAYREKIKGSF